MEIVASAHRHGIGESDILHAWENAIRLVEFEYSGEGRLLVTGQTATDACWNWLRSRLRRQFESSTRALSGRSSTTS